MQLELPGRQCMPCKVVSGRTPGHWNQHGYIPTYIHTYIHTYRQTDRQTDRQPYIHIYIPTYMTYMTYMTYIKAYLPAYLPTYLPTYIHTYIQTYIHTYIHTFLPTCLHICIHTYLHSEDPPFPVGRHCYKTEVLSGQARKLPRAASLALCSARGKARSAEPSAKGEWLAGARRAAWRT